MADDLRIAAKVTLIGVVATVVMHLFNLTFLPFFVTLQRRRLSIHFLINIISVIVGVILSFPWNLQIIYGWNSVDSLYNKRVVFWFATLSFGWLLAVSVSIGFLTLDRLLTLTLVHKYTRKDRHNMAIINVSSQIALYGIFILMQVGDMPEADQFAPCFLYMCVTQRATNFLFIKLTLGLTNAALGLTFFVYMCKYTKNRAANQTINLVGLFVVFNEFFLNFLPHLVSYVTSKAGNHIGKHSGPYTIYFFGLESSLLTLVTLKVVGVPFSKNGLGTLQVSSKNNVNVVTSTIQKQRKG